MRMTTRENERHQSYNHNFPIRYAHLSAEDFGRKKFSHFSHIFHFNAADL